MSNTPERDPRIYFAAERTFLAWLRTGLALIGIGFVVARFGLFLRQIAALTATPIPAPGSSRWFGIALIALGVLLTGVSYLNHLRTVRRLNRGDPFLGRPSSLGGIVAGLIVVAGTLMTIYLVIAT